MDGNVRTSSKARVLVARFAATAAVAFALSLGSLPAKANGFSNIAFLQPTDLTAFQQLSFGVAADGPIMAAAALPTGTKPGTVYVFVLNNGTWQQQAELTAPDSTALNNRFGSSIAVRGNLLFVGDGNAVDPSGSVTGAVYVFANVNGTWTLQQKLFPAGALDAISFGGQIENGIAINGNTLAVGSGGGQGSVFVFVNNGGGWVQQARIVPSQSEPLVAGFGFSVALSGDTLLVGAPQTSTAALRAPGAAFIFSRQNGVWTEQARIDPDTPLFVGNFADDVSLDGNTAVVGGPIAQEVDIWVKVNGNTWAPQAHLFLPDGFDETDFGMSLKVIGNLLLVGAYTDGNPDGVGSGKAYVYTRNGSTWTEHPDLEMAPGANGFSEASADLSLEPRFANFTAMSRLGGQTLFVLSAHGLNSPDPSDIRLVGGVYTAILNQN